MSNTTEVNLKRRKFLTMATGVVAGAGVASLSIPFLASWKPSARAQAAGAPVEVDISKMAEGQMLTIEWRGKPVWIVKRSQALLDGLPQVDGQLRDPQSEEDQQPAYAQNEYRSIKPEILVLVGVCTHLGCAPLFKPEMGGSDLGADWKGGFFCPCHGSKFDIAGRVYKNVPAPTNLVVPPYHFMDDNRIMIGKDPQGAQA
jgi:ubiquinol-cytochrome c reductase iron-sulfur subunit